MTMLSIGTFGHCYQLLRALQIAASETDKLISKSILTDAMNYRRNVSKRLFVARQCV